MSFNRARIATKNHVFGLSTAAITVAPAPDDGYGKENLLDPARSALCRVTGSTMEIVINTPDYPWVHALFLTNLAYSVTATIRIMGNGENVWSAPDYDSGDLPAYPESMPFGAGLFGSGSFGGYITTDDSPFYRPILPIYFDDLHTHTWWRVFIDNPDGDGTTGVGVVGLCSIVEMARNFSDGWKWESVDTTTMRPSTGGGPKVGRPGTRYDRFHLAFNNVPRIDYLPLRDAIKTLGQSTPTFMALHPESDDGMEAWTTHYGHIEKDGGGVESNPGLFDMSLIFTETPS